RKPISGCLPCRISWCWLRCFPSARTKRPSGRERRSARSLRKAVFYRPFHEIFQVPPLYKRRSLSFQPAYPRTCDNSPPFMSRRFDVVILGAGAAGLFCAAEAGKRGRRVAVLERSERPGKKILISGGGRCNFTNIQCQPENFLSANPHFA